MQCLVNSYFNRTYNPNVRQNALTDIKRLLTSRDTATQSKACEYLVEVASRYKQNSNERNRVAEYLLDNDITVFLCEAMSNLDFSLFKSILKCMRLLWRHPRFFNEEHAAHAMTAVLRALSYYTGNDSCFAVDTCLHFLCDLFNGINTYDAIAALSYQSAYSVDQLFACFNCLLPKINAKTSNILSSALVLNALISYQPVSLSIKGCVVEALADIIEKWFNLLLASLNSAMLMGDELTGALFVVLCQMGVDVFGLLKTIETGRKKTDFVQTILTDEQEINILKESACSMRNALQNTITQLVVYTKENLNIISTDEYSVFLKFILSYFNDGSNIGKIHDFCDLLLSKGYLTILPEVQKIRNDPTVRKLSILGLGEMLKGLSEKYLQVENSDGAITTFVADIHSGLLELQYAVEKPQSIGLQIQKSQPYSLLVYIYFYCQSSDNPGEATGPLLPYLVEHILRLPKSFRPPPYIIKTLWLVFAMASISNGTLKSLDERVYLEKAADRLIDMLYPEPGLYYTHNPAILLWAFTSIRIPNFVRQHVLTKWLSQEDTLPSELSSEPILWDLLLNIITQIKDTKVISNCMNTLYTCLEVGSEECRQGFAVLIWSMLPGVLSRCLIDYGAGLETNITNLLDLATTLIPLEIDQTSCLKTAVLLTAIFTKDTEYINEVEMKYHNDYVCLKLCLYLLWLSQNQNDNRVLLTYTNRSGFLSRILAAANSLDDKVAGVALQLLSYIVHYFSKNNYQPKSILEIQSDVIISSLRRDSASERGASLLQLVFMMLSNTSPVVFSQLASEIGTEQQYIALRALMFRVQMVCCRESSSQSSAGWKTLGAIFKHAIINKNDPKLVAALTSQPWIHILIHFQITQGINPEFLIFVQNWINLLKITLKNRHGVKKIHITKYSMVGKTLHLIKKSCEKNDEFEDVKKKIMLVVRDFFEEFNIRFN